MGFAGAADKTKFDYFMETNSKKWEKLSGEFRDLPGYGYATDEEVS